ncbi:piggyBac transposable element-derived protein 3-like [Anabrus simplex]|uniref:piggyBac transposable element-derived protein 3-like n=1 Tax=Anabrus simplex TaxID=316456 RepID=UPI0035A2B5A4
MSVDSPSEAEYLRTLATSVMAKAGFNLRGWEFSGDCSEVSAPMLGLKWDRKSDKLCLNISWLNCIYILPWGLCLFWDDQIINTIVNETKRYAMFKGNHNFDVDVNEIRLLIAILLLSGYCTVARHRLYWDSGADTYHPGVAGAILRNRFEELLRYLHISDNNTLNPNDKFAKVRPLWDHVNVKWLKFFPKDAYLSIDETMVPYFGRHGTKQHIENKPVRFGFKVWSMCSRLGYLVQAEPYQGASTGNTNPDLGVGGSVVVDMVNKLPQGSAYSIFTDNYFTSLPLLSKLGRSGHDCTGTIRNNRIENAPLQDPAVMKKLPRGAYDQVTDVNSGITLVRFNDNNIVTLASNRTGVSPMGMCSRWSPKERKRISVKQVALAAQYNLYMGGVDRLDQNVSAYRPGIRMKKWYWQLILFPLSCSINNAYQLYRMTPAGMDKGTCDFLGFIRYIVQCYLGKYTNRPAIGRPLKSVKRRVQDEVRLDGVGHVIISNPTQIRCAECHKNTTKKCRKCDVGCHANCFEKFHC